MDGVGWHFRQMSRGEINSNPMERELFSSESISERLVREVIQNSLDASLRKIDSNSARPPARVRFSLRGVRQPLNIDRAQFYLDGLFPHLAEGLDDGDDFRHRIVNHGAMDDGMPYLVIEDAGTAGLEGDWLQFDDSAELSAEDNYFYWFFRNVGRSGKSSLDGGSWGLGKWVFPDASQASAFIAVTRRRSDDETLLMGQTVLTKHTIGGQRYPPYGYFALEGEGGLSVPLRISEPDHRPIIEQCIDDFGLAFRDVPGLSVIVPFPRIAGETDLTRDRIAAAVVHNYFYPIIAGELEVIIDQGDGSPPTEITTDSIDDVLRHVPLEDSGERSMSSYLRLFEVCQDAATRPEGDYIELGRPPQTTARDDQVDELSELEERYRSGELLAFRVRTAVRRKGEGETPTSFRLFIQHDDSLKPGHDFHVRGWLSISGMDLIGKYPARALVLVDEHEPLAALLRDSEPPAHTSWRPRADRVRKGWVGASGRISDVINAPSRLLSIWEARPAPVERDALADIFPAYVSGDRRQRAVGSGSRGGGKQTIEPPPSHSDFVIQRSGLGFSVRIAPEAVSPPARVSLQVAYEIQRGNPLSAYSPHDFRLHGDNALNVQYQGCRLSAGTKENELILDIDDHSRFTVLVQGFDANRDIFTRVKAIAVEQTEDGETEQ